MRTQHFQPQNGLLTPSKKFFGKAISTIFMYLLTPFIVQNLKKCLAKIHSYKDASFLGPKQEFFQKTIT